MSLYVPVAVLSTPMFNAILSRWPSEPMVYHYRPLCMTVHTISQNTSQFISPALFPDSENPVRICCVVVPTKAKEGEYSSNPFEVLLLFFLLIIIFQKIALSLHSSTENGQLLNRQQVEKVIHMQMKVSIYVIKFQIWKDFLYN